jgi:hypothetical protein
MNELIQALVGLINKGSALAEPALYLFFALKFIEAWAFVLPFMTAIVLGYKLIRLRLETPTDKVWTYLQTGQPVEIHDIEGGRYFYKPSNDLLRRLGFTKQQINK